MPRLIRGTAHAVSADRVRAVVRTIRINGHRRSIGHVRVRRVAASCEPYRVRFDVAARLRIVVIVELRLLCRQVF